MGRPETDRALREGLTWRDRRPTLVAAILSAGAVAILIVAFASVSPFERPVALASLTSSVLWIAAALIGACGTIAALMLTTVSLLERLETRRMPPRVLFHLRLTVLGAVSAIALAVGALLLTTFPVAGGVDVEPPSWQIDAVFFGLLTLTALMVGAFAVVLTSLYATVSDVLRSLPQAWVDEILEGVEEIREEVEEIREGVEDAEADRPQQSSASPSRSPE
jgi:MFS family permease